MKDISYRLKDSTIRKEKSIVSSKAGKFWSTKNREISVSRKKTIGHKLKVRVRSGFSKKKWKFGGSEAKSPLSDLMQNYISGH